MGTSIDRARLADRHASELALFERRRRRVALAAPTGRAAKRMAEAAGIKVIAGTARNMGIDVID